MNASADSANLDPRRRRILFRAGHRGIREMDLILGQFARDEIAALSEAELDAFEALLVVDDADLYKWITGEAEMEDWADRALMARICTYRPDFDPVPKPGASTP